MNGEVKDVNPKEKMWLVRSSSKILGPYSLEELVQLLIINQISFVDEVKRSKYRWSYIREYPYLTEAVKTAKSKMNLEATKTANLTVTSNQIFNTGLTPPASANINFDEIKDIEPIHEVPFNYNPKAKSKEQIKSYGTLEDRAVKKQVSQASSDFKKKLLIAGVLVIILAIAGKVFLKIQEGNKVKGKISQIVRLNNLKLYDEAFKIYQEVKTSNEISPETLKEVNALRVGLGKETGTVRDFIQTYIDKSTNKKRAELFNILGLIYQNEGDVLKSNENFKKSLAIDPKNEWSTINIAIQKYKKFAPLFLESELEKEIVNEYKNFIDVKYENFENISYFNLIRGLYNFTFKEIFKDDLGFTIKEIQTQKNNTQFLKNENQVIFITLKKIENSYSDDLIIELLESLPRKSNDFSKNPLLDWSLSDWNFLEEICEKTFPTPSQFLPLLFRAYCSLEAGHYEKVDKFLNESLLLAKGSNYYDLMLLHLAYAKGEVLKVDSLIKKPDMGNFAVTYYYKGFQCLNTKNMECAKEAFNNLRGKFTGWTYLAQYGLYLTNIAEKQLIFESSRNEPLYKPVLLIKAGIEKSE